MKCSLEGLFLDRLYCESLSPDKDFWLLNPVKVGKLFSIMEEVSQSVMDEEWANKTPMCGGDSNGDDM